MTTHRPLALDVEQYKNDVDTYDAYRAYLSDWNHETVIADDLPEWLRWNALGKLHAERVEEAHETPRGRTIDADADEIDRLRRELARAAEVIAAQTFDVKAFSKRRRGILVKLAHEMLDVAEGKIVVRQSRPYDHNSVTQRRERVRRWELGS